MYLKCINKVKVKEILLPMTKQYCQFIKEVVEVSTEVMLLSSGRLYGTFEVGFGFKEVAQSPKKVWHCLYF